MWCRALSPKNNSECAILEVVIADMNQSSYNLTQIRYWSETTVLRPFKNTVKPPMMHGLGSKHHRESCGNAVLTK
jgi:hypothetical protein